MRTVRVRGELPGVARSSRSNINNNAKAKITLNVVVVFVSYINIGTVGNK